MALHKPQAAHAQGLPPIEALLKVIFRIWPAAIRTDAWEVLADGTKCDVSVCHR
jgi:hypothetical protein